MKGTLYAISCGSCYYQNYHNDNKKIARYMCRQLSQASQQDVCCYTTAGGFSCYNHRYSGQQALSQSYRFARRSHS